MVPQGRGPEASSLKATDSATQEIGSFDYVIVGAGTAGCVLANRLSADPGVSVLLLEAGGKDDYFWIHIPVGYLYTQNNPRTDWCFTTEAEPGLNGRALSYPRGKVLGGCSSINGMIYMRGQAADYDHWRQQGLAGWGWDDVLPYFKKSEDHVHGADEVHGSGGEWRVEEPRSPGRSWTPSARRRPRSASPRPTTSIAATTRAAAISRSTSGAACAGAPRRRSCARPARAPTSRVLTHAQADPDRARRAARGRARAAPAGRRGPGAVQGEVILASGAIGSPQLLQLSGIGPGELLQDLGIAPVHELAGVGENLQDHLQLRLVYQVEGTRTLNEQAASLLARGWMGLEYLLFRRGPLTMAPSQLGAFARSDPARATPNLEYHVQPLSLDKFGEPLHAFPAFTASVCNLRPESRGSVRIRSAEPDAPPAIRPNYLATEADRMVAAEAIRLTRRICAAPALARFRPQELRPGVEAQSDAELARAAGQIGTTIFHPVGTCRMGLDPGAVVDERLRVHGLARPARRRCLDHADHHLGQHQRPGDHDRGEGGRPDPRGSARAFGPLRVACARPPPSLSAEPPRAPRQPMEFVTDADRPAARALLAWRAVVRHARFWLAAVTLAGAGIGPGAAPALAQATQGAPAAPGAEGTPAPPATEAAPPGTVKGPRDGQKFQDWTLRCELPQGQPPEFCEMRQRVVNQQGDQVLLAVIGRLPQLGKPGLLIVLPLGISLPPGAFLKIDQGADQRVPVERCERQGCRIELVLEDELLAQLKAGSRAMVGFHVYDGEGGRPRVDVPVSLLGFSAALAEVMK